MTPITYEDIDRICGFSQKEGFCKSQCNGCALQLVWSKLYVYGENIEDESEDTKEENE